MIEVSSINLIFMCAQHGYMADMDLEKFFDKVCHSKLIEVLSRTIKDGRVIFLIHKYLNAGIIDRGMFQKTEGGT